jgi:periplasmic divalent cation tolerance protein
MRTPLTRIHHKVTREPEFSVVLVTAPNLKTGRKLARAALTARLVACANLIPRIESHYWWQGRLEAGAEVLLVMKTTTARLPALEKLVVAQHPYDTPEFVVLPISRGNKRYLDWVQDSAE